MCSRLETSVGSLLTGAHSVKFTNSVVVKNTQSSLRAVLPCLAKFRRRVNILKVWQFLDSLLIIWQNVEPSLEIFQCYWAHCHCYKFANIEKSNVAIWSHCLRIKTY